MIFCSETKNLLMHTMASQFLIEVFWYRSHSGRVGSIQALIEGIEPTSNDVFSLLWRMPDAMEVAHLYDNNLSVSFLLEINFKIIPFK